VADKHLKIFDMIPGAAVIAGFIVASLLSTFLLQSGINGSHQSKLSQALAGEIAQQINIKEAQLVEQLGKSHQALLPQTRFPTPSLIPRQQSWLSLRFFPSLKKYGSSEQARPKQTRASLQLILSCWILSKALTQENRH